MEYEITMPRLTDTMETGKIVRWLKKVGDKVERNEPIVEVESDKAVMEVPSFQSGVLVKILAEEGDEIPVGKPIAVLETEEEKAKTAIKEEKPIEKREEKPKPPEKKEKKIEVHIEEVKEEKLPEGAASPAARKLAAKLGVDIKSLQEKGKLPSPAHEKDIKEYFYSQFFTREALEIAKSHNLSPEDLYNTLKKKITKKIILEYIEENNIPEEKEIPSIQKSLISSLQRSLEIPTYHIYETFDFSLVKWDKEKTFTVWFIKILGDFMMKYPQLRTVYKDGKYYTYPNSNITVAVATEEGELFAPVVKQVNKKSLKEISDVLHSFREKSVKKSFTVEDLKGGTFAVSNLGMFGVEYFDAIIPPEHSGIVAIGVEKEDKTAKLTFSFDHRIINGREAAIFVEDFKQAFKDEKYLSSIK
ncbi:MAG: 2-oxo acid dehydrogenase subunit E2 [Aquificota bacterium]|nr:MAG: 2-oxo acid dehydrogenase subunit E2 [Aquificota bacterium]